MKEKEFEKKQSAEDQKLSKTRVKVIVLNVINVLLLLALFFILNGLSSSAQKVKQLRSESLSSQNESDAGVLKAELDNNKESIDKISDAFVDEERFLDFYSAVNSLQQTGVISNFNLPVTSPVQDSNKLFGLPISMTIKGSESQVNEVIRYLNRLPYILKPVNIDMDVSLEGEVTLRYGGFLYTDESFTKN